MPRRIGFTLVELLVTVTIIVVLLAMLLPAMEGAVYQASLLHCSSRLKHIGSGVTAYAVDNLRLYPDRPGVRDPVGDWYTIYLYAGAIPSTDGKVSSDVMHDDRVLLQGYVHTDMLVDPLCREVDMSMEANGPQTWVFGSYSLWYGWKYQRYGGIDNTAMQRVGERFSWTDKTVTSRFNYLASDLDQINKPFPNATTSHPDKGIGGTNRMVPFWAQTGSFTHAEGEGSQWSTVTSLLLTTYSYWRVTTTYQRGPMDINVVAEDGSVRMDSDVEFDDTDRMTRVPVADSLNGWHPNNYTRYHNLPKL